MTNRFARLAAVVAGSLIPAALTAQAMDHSQHAAAPAAAQAPVPSQAAFATIQEIVKRLKADPKTDWSKVNLEALRQHLIDMDNVVMRSVVKQANIAGGVSLDITGTGDVAAAIKRMGGMHSAALTSEGDYAAESTEIANGVRLVVKAKNVNDAAAVARLRGLGFAGLLTEGDHHSAHHWSVAKGEPMMHGNHKP